MGFLLQVIDKLFLIYTLMIFARIISSWFPELREYTAMQYVIAYTDPYLEIFRRIIPPLGMIDFSPIVALFALQFIEYGIKYLLITLFA